MSYTSTNWQTGDTVTAERLNKMELGIESADVFDVTLTPTSADYSGTMDKTPHEISEAYRLGQRIRFLVPALSAAFYASTFMDIYNQEIQVNGQFVFFIDSLQTFVLMNVTTDNEYSTYRTYMFPLTPAS